MLSKKIMIIFGTRPEAIKVAAVVKKLKEEPRRFKIITCVTSQHKQMLTQVLSLFNIKPDIDLNLMRKNQTLQDLTAVAIRKLSKIMIDIKPDLVLVQGDTTTAMIGALAAFYQRIPVGHIEAGLRTSNRYYPFPEEINRRIISVLATLHFAPTKSSLQALFKEGVNKKYVSLTGNTVVDALNFISCKAMKNTINLPFNNKRKLILVTAHRRENFGEPLRNICKALKMIVERNNAEIVYPVHLNPNVKNMVYSELSKHKNIHLITPVDYRQLVFLLKKAYLVLTDSGGIQEEAPTFGKPVLVLRNETERPEGVEYGVAKLVGTDTKKILRETELLLSNHKAYSKMSKAISPYGDGMAAQRIVAMIARQFSKGTV